MTFGELLGSLLGWLGNFVEWLVDWVPVYEIVQFNEMGVRYHCGNEPIELGPGVHWYIPNLDTIEKHHASRDVLQIESLSLETSDGIAVQVGMVLTYHITDVLRYEVENLDADEAMSEVAQGAMREIVTSHSWDDLRSTTEDGTRLGNKLKNRMSKVLDRFGVEVESCRPTDQIRLARAMMLFGVNQSVEVGEI